MIELSVIVCTHNPRPDYLGRVLDALRAQTLPKDQWNLLIVDNASSSPVELEWDCSWHPSVRYVVEGELGLAFARQRGMQEAVADLLVFVDDDNVIDPEYLSEVVRIKRGWPLLGVWGSGATIPEFEVEPPHWLSRMISGERSIKTALWSNIPGCSEAAPWGAGLCVRSEVAMAYCMHLKKSRIKITDRQGKTLWGGGDAEICIVACDAGFGMGIFPQLRLTHLISQGRLTKTYMLKFTEGLTASATLLEYKWASISPRSPFSVHSILSMIKNVLVHRGIERWIHFVRWRGVLKAKRIIDHQKDTTSNDDFA